jgi:hypothetical protein
MQNMTDHFIREVYPMRRKAALMALLLIALCGERGHGKAYLPDPVSGCKSLSIAIACSARGTICGCFIFIFSAEIFH